MAAAPLDANTRAALMGLADIAVPPPVSWVPRTWGWLVVGGLLLAVAGWVLFRAVRRYAANRYRRAALVELRKLELRLADERQRGEALVAFSALLKRVALAAWPRPAVAPLSGAAWVGFLRAHSGANSVSDEVAALLDDLEYRERAPSTSVEQGRAVALAVRRWIEGHVVSA